MMYNNILPGFQVNLIQFPLRHRHQSGVFADDVSQCRNLWRKSVVGELMASAPFP